VWNYHTTDADMRDVRSLYFFDSLGSICVQYVEAGPADCSGCFGKERKHVPEPLDSLSAIAGKFVIFDHVTSCPYETARQSGCILWREPTRFQDAHEDRSSP
jgi:hypothetical protein